ncbi:MAG: hypothetical protein J1F60_11240, partial [Oscillospiraceae bacterium]|nr:hypothetical protein [Oscillospiraceae bacterium]
RYYSGIGTEYIWEQIAAVKDLENTGIYSGKAAMELELNVYLPELDRAPSIYVTSDGYIHTTLNPMGCAFYIGTDMANEIISYIVDNYQEDNSVSGAV